MPEAQMHEFKPERRTAGIVLLGSFNALQFHPLWFKEQEVFSPDEVDNVLRRKDEMICAPGFATFHTSHILLKVEDSRFEVTALKEPLEAVVDVCKKIFEGLETQTVTAMGINTTAHFRMPDISTFHKFGDLLAPKDRWSGFLGADVSGDDRQGGLASLSMMRKKTEGKGSRMMKIERSGAYSPPSVGIFVNCNDHFSFESNDNIGVDVGDAMEILAENFNTTLNDFLAFYQDLFRGL